MRNDRSTLFLCGRAALLLLALGLAAAVAQAGPPQTIEVTGQNDVAVDRIAIQAAVDAAAPGDTVLLDGTFQLDGTPIYVRTRRLTIAGVAIDDDGDGRTNEDRPDGVDDDGDGLTDEDGWNAVLLGVDDGAGGPAGDAFPNRFNDGFEILGFDETLWRIEFRDLEMQRLNRGIYLFPDYDDDGTVFLCDASTPRAGSLALVTVERNAFVNGIRGVEVIGSVNGVRVRDNLFAGISGNAVMLFGQTLGCAEPDGSIVEFLPLGTPRRVVLARNTMQAVRVGLLSYISDRTTVRSNSIEAFTGAVISIEDEHLLVARNDIVGGFFGVLGSYDDRFEGPSRGNRVWQNRISDTFYGVLVDCTTTGYTAIDNEFSGSLVADVVFDGTAPGGFCAGIGDSYGNTVVAPHHPTTVQDYGVDNRLIGPEIIDITVP